jgi:uncharacterized protein YjiS (DUF1127 family)
MSRIEACGAPSLHVASPLGTIGSALRSLAQRLAAWHHAHKRAAEDRHTLASMSDRELRDIGVARASIDAIADGDWLREAPR